MPRDWESIVQSEAFTDVMKLVHLAMRLDQYAVESRRLDLLQMRRGAYEDELTIQARRVGCPGRSGRLTRGPSLSQLNDMSQQDAESIVNTYNYDLAMAIIAIHDETPTANRHVYASRLQGWEARREQWKSVQIAQYTEGTARSLAQSDFYMYNDVIGRARLEPTEAVCPVCQGWVNRGDVPLRIAQNNPPPYHIGCPHGWETEPDKVAASECAVLWMGE